MTDTLGGLGGLFSGLGNGLQLLLALQKAEQDRKIRQGELDINRSQEGRAQAKYESDEADKPALNYQEKVLKPLNAVAGLSDIQREYTPPPVADTFQTSPLAAPAFGQGLNQPSGPTLGKGTAPRLQTADPNASHMAQVLERARRNSNFNANQDILTQTLAAAGREAQRTQAPVAGHFGAPGSKDEGQLPQGFAVQAEKTFTPYQYGGGTNRHAAQIATAIRLLRSRIPPEAIKMIDLMGLKPGQVAKLFPAARADLAHLVELQNQYEREVGADNPGGGQGQEGGASSADPITILGPRPTSAGQQQADWDRAAAAIQARP